MKFIYMNEEIRKAKPKRPVIVCQEWDGSQRESNAFAISINGRHLGYVRFNPEGLEHCETHEVKAWVEFEDEVDVKPCAVVDLTEEEAAALEGAHPKHPNTPVFLPELWTPAILKELKRK
jgi:hypothetical protein